jgi:hypothetical protein
MPLHAPGDGRFLLVLYPQIAGCDLEDAKAYRRCLPAWDLHHGSRGRLNNPLSRQEWCQEVARRAHERRSVTLGLLGKHLQYIRDTE